MDVAPGIYNRRYRIAPPPVAKKTNTNTCYLLLPIIPYVYPLFMNTIGNIIRLLFGGLVLPSITDKALKGE